jgi:hypothetical protein
MILYASRPSFRITEAQMLEKQAEEMEMRLKYVDDIFMMMYTTVDLIDAVDLI